MQAFEQILTKRWNHFKEDAPDRISLKYDKKEELADIRKLKQLLYIEYGPIKSYNSMYDNLKNRAETMAFMFDFEKISFPSIIENIKFNSRDIDEILLAYISRNDDSDITSAADFLCDAIYVKYMAKAYNDVKKRYFENNRETVFVELEGLERELNETQIDNQRLSKDLSGVQIALEALERENRRLKEQLKIEQRNKDELKGLREFLFNLNNQEEYVSEDEEVDIKKLKNFKGILIGGHEKWQTKMKEYLPAFTFIHPDYKTFDVRLLEGTNVVFIYTNYLNHAIYERVMGTVEGKEIKIAYLNQQNEKFVLQEIWKVYQENK